MAASAAQPRTTTRRMRVFRENLIAYALLSPAMILLFIFGIFPVGFAFFVSLHRWRRFPGEYQGLDNYVRALGDFAHILFFWLAVIALIYAASLLIKLFRSKGERLNAMTSLVPGLLTGAAILAFVNWTAILLPLILDIPQRIRGQERVPGIFVDNLVASFQFPEAVAAGNTFLLLLIAAVVVVFLWQRFLKSEKWDSHLVWSSALTFAGACGFLLLNLTLDSINAAVLAVQEDGIALPVWSQIILISAGVGLLGVAYLLWRRSFRQENSNRRALAIALLAILLVCAGYIFITQLPSALVEADRDVMSGFSVTIMFVLGTVPFQLAIGLGLAYLLYQNIKAKSMFRIAYFIPYIMPFVATSIVFRLIFSHESSSLINQLIGTFGVPAQKWLLEPKGVFSLIFPGLPSFLAGPSLALIVIMIYTTWTYIGYDTAIFLAGLGSIPADVYEAAKIDGANSWQMFRRITLPLLSPTTFFLTLIAVIGSFQAFSQFWIMRTPAAGNSVDTIGIYIFETVQATDPNMGYGSALALVLFVVILLLTLFQNRLAERSVFYG